MKKTCIVAGGAGFIGSNLVEELLCLGYRVLAIDNLLTGSESNLAEFNLNPEFKFINQDIISPFNINEKIDYIFHFASPASPVDYQEYPIETLLVNSIGTKNLLDIAVKNNSTILFASTSEIYGDPLEHPQKETYWGNVNPNGVRSCYDEAKRFGESMITVYQRKFNLKTKIIRIFNTYGPKMQKDDGRVISNFVNQAIVGKDLTIYGKGEQTRSFCYIDDLVEGIFKTMFSDKSDNGVYNLGNPEERSVMEIAKIIIELTKSKSKIKVLPLPADDPKKRKPDISKIKAAIGWEPKINLKEGLLKTIEYFKSIK
jgi:nucleoside-diphosphate-sugar epimerase